MRTTLAEYMTAFLLLALPIGINLGGHLMNSLQITLAVGPMVLISLVCALALANQRISYIVLVAGLSLIVNLPDETLASYGLDRVLLCSIIISVIILPILNRVFELELDR